ncbi:MAG: hypothetical protein OEW00_05590, partial [candidate division Zixibacteria bacterium]|nr:hypothetical protein [candidate division Zixibacteria bacterium]
MRNRTIGCLFCLIAALAFLMMPGKIISEDANSGLEAVAAKPATGEKINWQVLSGGGTDGSSTQFKLKGTLGQTAVGFCSGPDNGLNQGFWQVFVSIEGCCRGIRGNANNDPDDKVNISDVTFLLEYLFGIPTGPAPVCWEEANANGDPDEKVNVS